MGEQQYTLQTFVDLAVLAFAIGVLASLDGGVGTRLSPSPLMKLEAPRRSLPTEAIEMTAVETDLRDSFVTQFDAKPIAPTRELLTDVQKMAERYGRTGAPYDEPKGRNDSSERAPKLTAEQDRLVSIIQSAGGSAAGEPSLRHNFDESLAIGARLREFADGAGSTTLAPVVEVTQTDDETALRVLQPSTSSVVDAWVTERVRSVVRTTRGRTVWRFDCRFVYKKTVNGLGALDVARVAGSIALSAASGARAPLSTGLFDEVSGRVEVVDLTSPRLQCRPVLLERGSDRP